MVILRRNKNQILLVVLALLISSFCLFSARANAASYCWSDACKEAQAKEREYNEKAAEMSAIAETYEEAVAQLNAEIASIQASIDANQALADDIAVQIEETEQKLLDQEEALAEILINMHFDSDTEPIQILASSSSISDLAEKQAREEVIKKEIAAASEQVKELKASLEDQKATVESLIAEQSEKRSEVAAKRSEQAALVAQYENNAAEYASVAAAAKAEKEELMTVIAEETATCQYSGYTTTQYSNTYPFASSCPWSNLQFTAYSGYVCQCTSYASWKAREAYGAIFSGWGNAKNWGWDYWGNPLSYKGGYRVDTVVEAGTIAVSNCGTYGHVMWVESVNGDGTINVSEYNNYGSNIYHRVGDFGSRTHVSVSGLRFIHFD